MLVTTTESVQGYTVLSYIGPVAAHIVAGTNVFSDFAASLSDVFGGQSKSYQKQLEAINKEAIRQLTDRSQQRGANAILGLRIDHDEISGSGKSMFMVTAVGTAVRIEGTREDKKEESGSVSSDEMKVAVRTREILHQVENENRHLNDEDLEFFTRHRVAHVAPHVLNLLYSIEPPVLPTERQKLNKIERYFQALGPVQARKHLTLAALSKNPTSRNLAHSLFESGHGYSLEDVLDLLRSDKLWARIRGVQFLRHEPLFYTADDIQKLEAILETLGTGFSSRWERYKKDKTFGSGSVTMVRCTCGAEQKEQSIGRYCHGCHRDEFGFKEGLLKHNQAAWYVKTRKSILEQIFNSA